jgi:hypothetical protein
MEKKANTTRLERVKKLLEDLLFFLLLDGVLFLFVRGLCLLAGGSAESKLMLHIDTILILLLLILVPVYVIARIIVAIYEACTRRRK